MGGVKQRGAFWIGLKLLTLPAKFKGGNYPICRFTLIVGADDLLDKTCSLGLAEEWIGFLHI